ncbi:MAG: ribosome-binding factor, partial [Phycisphaerales bacterium]|nr:ribosome-binding factor [Phycisphaerales bacterium]
LTGALADCGDDVLQGLMVLAVDPVPDAGHLLVTVSPGPAAAVATADLTARLANAAGRLRAEVARDIVRKRAPELSFRVLPAGEVGQ